MEDIAMQIDYTSIIQCLKIIVTTAIFFVWFVSARNREREREREIEEEREGSDGRE